MKQFRITNVIGAVTVLVLCSAGTTAAQAQTQSLFGSRGPANQIGSNLRGSMVGRSTTFGSTGLNFGSTGLSGQPVFGTTTGTTATGQAGGAVRQGQAGTQAAFVGRGDNAGRFVGNQMAGQQTSANGGGSQFRNSASQFRNLGGRAAGGTQGSFNPGRNGSQAGTSRLVFRPKQRIAFSFPERESSSLAAALTAHFDRLSYRAPGLAGVNVVLDGEGAVTLKGVVDSAETKQLAAIMARMEPGVRTVQNELTVRTGDSPPPSTDNR